MWAERNVAVDKLEELNDPCLQKLKYEHRIDPLWSELKFGDWLELRLAFVEERGYVRGFRQGVKAAQAQLGGVAPALTSRQRLILWLSVWPISSVALTLLVNIVVKAVQQESLFGVALVCTISPVFVALQVAASWNLVRMAINKALGKDDDNDRVILVKSPDDLGKEVTSEKGVKDISSAIANSDDHKRGE